MSCKNPLPHGGHEYLADSEAVTLSRCAGRVDAPGAGTEAHTDAYLHARGVLLRSLADGIVWELGRIQVRATGPTRWAALRTA